MMKRLWRQCRLNEEKHMHDIAAQTCVLDTDGLSPSTPWVLRAGCLLSTPAEVSSVPFGKESGHGAPARIRSA